MLKLAAQGELHCRSRRILGGGVHRREMPISPLYALIEEEQHALWQVAINQQYWRHLSLPPQARILNSEGCPHMEDLLDGMPEYSTVVRDGFRRPTLSLSTSRILVW
jgi:hypothetical protein